jgi:hypothetical protein
MTPSHEKLGASVSGDCWPLPPFFLFLFLFLPFFLASLDARPPRTMSPPRTAPSRVRREADSVSERARSSKSAASIRQPFTDRKVCLCPRRSLGSSALLQVSANEESMLAPTASPPTGSRRWLAMRVAIRRLFILEDTIPRDQSFTGCHRLRAYHSCTHSDSTTRLDSIACPAHNIDSTRTARLRRHNTVPIHRSCHRSSCCHYYS